MVDCAPLLALLVTRKLASALGLEIALEATLADWLHYLQAADADRPGLLRASC